MNSLRAATRNPAAQPGLPHARETTILLIRHGHTDAIGVRLAGRSPGVELTAIGRQEAARVAFHLRHHPIAAIYASPLERAVATAEPLARAVGLPVSICDALLEVDFGDWTGLTFAELEQRTDWRRFNTERARAPVPGGETAAAVQARIVAALTGLRTRHESGTIAVFSHADVIRAAVLHYMGMPLDGFHRVEIDPASITALRLGDRSAELLYINIDPKEIPSAPGTP